MENWIKLAIWVGVSIAFGLSLKKRSVRHARLAREQIARTAIIYFVLVSLFGLLMYLLS